jgi:hypothetical protein
MILYLYKSDSGCISHDEYIQLGSFPHSVEEHIKLNPTIEWIETYWVPDCFGMRYKRSSFQRTERANEGSPRTDNSVQIQTRLERTL